MLSICKIMTFFIVVVNNQLYEILKN